MRRHAFHFPGVLLILMIAVFAGLTEAEIYKWVDAQGNVHFGDKPKDPEQADKAEPVDIVESYQPSGRTDPEQDAYDRQQQALERKSQVYKQEDLEKRKVAQDRRKEEKAALCTALESNIRKFGTTQVIGGVPTYHYWTGEDGKSISSKRQKEIVEELKREYAAAGCK